MTHLFHQKQAHPLPREMALKSYYLKTIPPLIGLSLFILALWVLHRELQAYHLKDIGLYLHAIPGKALTAALMLTIFSYGVMTGYDYLALKFVNRKLAYRRIAAASFVGYAFSNNIGFSMLAGASVRYRLYSSWGLSALEITKIIFFCTISLWLGFFTLSSVIFLLRPMVLPHALLLPFKTDFPLGILLLIPVLLYVVVAVSWKGTARIGSLEFSAPPLHIFLPQIGIATLDWFLAGSVLFIILPPGIPFSMYLEIYMLAQIAAILSQIPGGLGVFEAMMLLFLSKYFPASSALASLIVYRAVYYILPLLIAAVILAAKEVLDRKHLLMNGSKAVTERLFVMVPALLTVVTFLSGVILLFSGATPAVTARLLEMERLFPLPIIEVSHFLGSVVGVSLLILSWGIQRRVDTSYYLTIALLGTGVLFSLLKGLDYEEAAILSMIMLIVIPSRPSFYRKGSLLEGKFPLPWIIAVVIAIICTAWLTFFSYKHMEYSTDLWWHFAFMQNAPRSLRALVGSSVAVLAFALIKILQPFLPKPDTSNNEDLARAMPILRNSPETYANLALLGDKAFLFNTKGNACIMYGIEGRNWISMGDPIGPENEWPELAWQFCEMCDRYDVQPAFYEVGSKNLHIYIDLGMTLVKLGEEAKVNLQNFSLSGRSRKDLRHVFNKLTNEGCTFEIVSAPDVPTIEKDLRRISDAWLADKHTTEKTFSLGSFREEYISRFPVAIIRKEGNIIAFANVWTTDRKEELSVDLMRSLPQSSAGSMEYLFIHLMIWGAQNGYQWFNLGMAPLSGLEGAAMASLWNRIGSFIFRHAEYFYNFQGLRLFKENFSPEWKPRYLASYATFSLPIMLGSIASLTSGGLKGIASKK